MPLRFRTKLLASHAGLVAVVIVGTVLALNWSLGADLSKRLEVRLEEQARGAADWIGSGRHPDRIAGRLAKVVDGRVTILDRNGKVLGDSEHPGFPEQADADGRDQPEVRVALSGRVGRAIRTSADTGKPMQYLAIPVGDHDGLIVRLGVPLDEIKGTLAAMRRRLILTSALALAAALLLGLLAARVAVRPLRAMTDSAARIARGDYDIALAPTAKDEFGELARSLSSLGAQLKARIGDLTAERDRLSAMLAGMVEGVLVVDAAGRVVMANPSAGQILGAGADLHGKTLADVPHVGVRALLDDALRAGGSVERELNAGGAGLLTVNVQPLAAAAGGGVVAVLHDVTRLRRLETVRRDFIANASHELRTPVAAIQGYAETLLGPPLDAATSREFTEIIHRHARRIGRLVEGLLRLSELEARPPEQAVREPVAVAAVAGQVALTVGKRAAEIGTRIVVQIPGDDVIARGDPIELEQVIENLVENAVKYGRAGGTVTVAGRRAGARVLVTVADEGPGIAAEHLPRLFERFYRVEPGRSREQGGTGLGLAIVKHLVESMGGTVTVASQPGAGTTFTVDLPSS